MTAIIKTFFRLILLTVFSANLIACGGAGDNTPPPPEKDSTAPIVMATKPTSEQIGITTNAFIEVMFNEAIAITNVTTDQIDIYPYDTSNLLSATLIKLQQNPFSYDNRTNTLSIKPEINALQRATKYQVTIRDIKDTSGNIMVNSCQWEFVTVGLPEFGVGNTGVCGTVPPAIVPNNPRNVKAVAGDGSVTISWQTPNVVVGVNVAYYTLEKSINNAQSFSDVDINISATTLSRTDINAINNTSHIYRVRAGNDYGLSNGVNSNAVTPKAVQVSAVPGVPQNVNAVAGNATVTVNWFAPITGDTVSFYNVEKSVNNSVYALVKEKIPATSLSYIDIKAQNNASHIYRVTAGNAIGLSDAALSNFSRPKAGVPPEARVELISESPVMFNFFGRTMAYSPDGNTLVIGEHGANPGGGIEPGSTSNAGAVQIFTKANGIWTPAQRLKAQTPMLYAGFGFSLAISQDGSMLAIGSVATNYIELYIKSGSSWIFSKKLVSNRQDSTTFANTLAFHPNSAILAIGEAAESINGLSTASSVQLFIKSGSTWTFSQLLTSGEIPFQSAFGSEIKFSPDGSTLAIAEAGGNPPSYPNAGVVHLFTQNGSNWSLKQKLVSNNPGSSFDFGGGLNNVNFSPDSNSLVIGEQGASTIQLFTRATNKWSYSQTLTVANATSSFGSSVAYSMDGNTIAVSEVRGTTNQLTGAGNVYLFNKSSGNWILDRIITAVVPVKDNGFGVSLFFSPVNNELAISEYYGNSAGTTYTGVVSIIDLSKLP